MSSKSKNYEEILIETVPKHWHVFRLKDRATFNPSKSEMKELPRECTFAPMEKLKTDSLLTDLITTTSDISSSYTYFRENDILIAKVTPCFENRNIAVAQNLTNKIGFGSSEINVVRLSKKVNQRWFLYLFLSSKFIEAGASKMAGAGGLKRIPSLFLETFSFALPSLEEQTTIAAYLDTKTSQIDRKIELLNQKATYYGKLKQSLINETVTRGLDKFVPMKATGVEWIGEVPEHWQVKRLKDLFTERSQKGYPNEPLLIASQTLGVTLKSSYSRNTMTVQDDFHLMKLVKKSDFVISLRSFEGGIEMATHRGIISAAYTILFSIDAIEPKFYKHLFKSTVFISLLATCTTGIREGRNVNYQQLKRELLPIPPLHEQQIIASYLDEKTAQIDRIVVTINAQIDKLKELRKVLINDVVTGKIKVTNVESEV